MVPTIRKEAPTGNVGDNPLQAVSNRFLQVRGNRITDVTEAVFNLTQEDEGLETPPPKDSSKASLSPPVGGNCLSSFRSDWQTNKCSNNVLKIITNGYILPIHLKAKVSQSSPDSLRIKGPAKSSGSGRLYPLSSVKNTIERVENVKSLGFYSRLFFCPQASPKVEASDRPQQAQHLRSCRKVQNGNSKVRASLIPGEWVSSIDLQGAYLHIPIHQNSRKYLRFCHNSQVFQSPLPFGLATAP